MDTKFQDRSQVLFGRDPDLSHLIDRAGQRGITAIVGRAQMGKSWLLTELARQLSQDASSPNTGKINPLNLQQRQFYSVGYAESLGETADLLLRAVVDLYTRWLSDSGYWEQAQVIWRQHKKDLISKSGEAVGLIFEKISKLGPRPIEALGGLVKETFNALADANRDLVTGGVLFPRLQVEQGRDLLKLVSEITGCPMVLVLDQLEKSPGIELETKILDSFLRQLDQWPPCHIFLGLRTDPGPLTAINRLHNNYPGLVEMYDLPSMHLEEDAISRAALIRHVRDEVPATAGTCDGDLLEMIAGYPGTVALWTSSHYAKKINSEKELREVADNANSYRFAEFDDLLPTLSDGERLIGMRLAMLSVTSNVDIWNALRTTLLQGAQSRDLDGLKRKNVLQSSSPPSFGHAKRLEAALQWFTDKNHEELREISESIIFTLAGQVRNVMPQAVPYVSALVNLQLTASKVTLSNLPRALCEVARSLAGLQTPDHKTLLTAADEVRNDAAHRNLASILAMGLVNAMPDAKQEQAFEQRALERRDALAEKLRQLSSAYPEDAALSASLAIGCLNQMIGANEQARDALLKEVRQLTSRHSEDTAVREVLARGLYQRINDAKQHEAPERRDAFLDELRQLVHDSPEDVDIRNWFAKGIFKSMNAAKQEGELDRRDTLLEEVRHLAYAYPQDSSVRIILAMALVNTSVNVQREGALERRDDLLQELQELADTHAQDASVRQSLAYGLTNAVIAASKEQALERRDKLTQELRKLARTHPQDAQLSELLGKVLVNGLNDAEREAAPERRDVLLEELRQLARVNVEFAGIASVREDLVKALFNLINYAQQEQVLDGRDALLEELRRAARVFPHDGPVRVALAKCLYNTMNDARREGVLERRNAILTELRQLSHTYPQDAAVREVLVRSLSNTLNAFQQDGALERGEALLDELRQLAHIYTQDAEARKGLAQGLVNTISSIKHEGGSERQEALFDELRQLSSTHPMDVAVQKLLAAGIANALGGTKKIQASGRRDTLLEELRQLFQASIKDASWRVLLATGVFNALNLAKRDEHWERRDELLDELRLLAHTHPQDAPVQGFFASGLSHTINDPQLAQDRQGALLEELRQLSRAYPEDKIVSESVARATKHTQ